MLLLVDVGARPPMGHPSAVTCVAAAIAAAAAALGVHAMGGAAAGTFLVGGGGGGGGGSGKSNGNAASRGRRHTPPGVATTGGSGAVASTSASTGRWQPGSADLTIVVGSRSFSVHRGVIAACSGYCRQRLADSGGSTGQLDLPDADADAFALLLRWLYTGATVIPATHAQAVAELADRLLLPPELCRAAQSQVRLARGVGCRPWVMSGRAFQTASLHTVPCIAPPRSRTAECVDATLLPCTHPPTHLHLSPPLPFAPRCWRR